MVATRRSTRSPARQSRSPREATPQARTPTVAKARPLYHSDGDTRPVYRGTSYAVVRESGLAWAVLLLYACYAVWHYVNASNNIPLLFCRCVHIVVIVLNVVFSDDLHNHDKHVGASYSQKQKAAEITTAEQQLHATDWRAALGIPASYHLLLIVGIQNWCAARPVAQHTLRRTC